MRELLRAVVIKRSIVTVLEAGGRHGALTRAEVQHKLTDADAPCHKYGKDFADHYEMWGLRKEVESWIHERTRHHANSKAF
jgi:hypothetical protein